MTMIDVCSFLSQEDERKKEGPFWFVFIFCSKFYNTRKGY